MLGGKEAEDNLKKCQSLVKDWGKRGTSDKKITKYFRVSDDTNNAGSDRQEQMTTKTPGAGLEVTFHRKHACTKVEKKTEDIGQPTYDINPTTQ